jgi:methylmalonyl-CoA/ethylmalonyl-CoA epimerase
VKIKRIEHVAIAVRDMKLAQNIFGNLGIETSYEETIGAVRLAMLPIGESALEFIQPLERGTRLDDSIEQNGEGLHHICLEVDDIESALAELKAKGIGLIDQVPRTGHGNSKIAFIDRAFTSNVLVELVELPKS